MSAHIILSLGTDILMCVCMGLAAACCEAECLSARRCVKVFCKGIDYTHMNDYKSTLVCAYICVCALCMPFLCE